MSACVRACMMHDARTQKSRGGAESIVEELLQEGARGAELMDSW